jgi:hypothetical protein
MLGGSLHSGIHLPGSIRLNGRSRVGWGGGGRVGTGKETGAMVLSQRSICNFTFLIFCIWWKFWLTRENITLFTFFMRRPVFIRVWPNFTGFRVWTSILHVFCVLTRKIERFYELIRIFNNHEKNDFSM